MNYSSEYNLYWLQSDRIGESSGDLQRVANEILLTCGSGTILDIGSGEGELVCALLDRGVSAVGLDVSEVVVARSNDRAPGRFFPGSVLALPFDDDAFETVVSTDCMEHLAPEDVPAALREILRVTRKNVFLKIATTQDRDGHWHLTVEGRAWWEARCFEAGFRKHPAYYKINNYESLNNEGWQISIVLEKLPAAAANAFPLESLSEERGLHMDMLRDAGERSDAHVIRYDWASGYVKPGDRVLDAACGLGYGGRVIAASTRADRIIGIDGSKYAIDYAKMSFSEDGDRVRYELGMLPEALSALEDNSVDLVTSFETLEHVADPVAVLREFHRILVPGGRILVSVPNDWSDASGEDPNPYHLHVYDWGRLKTEISEFFTLEEAYAQTASQCKVPALGANVWERRGRMLRRVEIAETSPMDCEWWLMVGMKSPLESSVGYSERVFSNIANTGHPSIRYGEFFSIPWLMHSMVNVTHRLKDVEKLDDLCGAVLDKAAAHSNDYRAALCVQAYRALDPRERQSRNMLNVIALIDEEVAISPGSEMALRWRISLLFAKARLLQALGDLAGAASAYEDCAGHDVRAFGVHLATKTTEASFVGGRIALSLGQTDRARACWERGLAIGEQLLGVSLDDILINRSHPNLFNHGDGVREYTLAWDNIARCANGLALLAEGRGVDESLLQGSFQTEYSVVTRDVLSCRGQLGEQSLELKSERRALEERTKLLEQANVALESVTDDLVGARSDLADRSDELVRARLDLVERTKLLEQANVALESVTDDLVGARSDLADRSDELVRARLDLVERTRMLEQANEALANQTEELVWTRQELVERTGTLERVITDLNERTARLEQANAALDNSGAEALVLANRELHTRSSELAAALRSLEEKEELLKTANAKIVSLSQGVLRKMWRRVRRGN
ncbi:methyltransferase domain-containing protein [Dyella ginsengisoli]|uniref:Methyltransferase domain-containing protein n=1 Tax=Dyella ginsengisoli TaxID=363848 RepID=A0ABW8JSN7_9GAMM